MYRILLVDDEAVVTDWIYQLLNESFGASVEVYKCNSSLEALTLLSKASFDIALIDMNMPVINGIRMLEELSQKWPQTKKIVLTGYEQFEYARKALELNVVAYILKTEDDDAILDAVRHAMSEIDVELKNSQLEYRVRTQMELALPAMRKEFISGLAFGQVDVDVLSKAELEALKLDVDITNSCCVLLVMTPQISSAQRITDAVKLVATAEVAISEYLSIGCQFNSVRLSISEIIWLIQPTNDKPCSDECWQDFYQRLPSLLENAQKHYCSATGGYMCITFSAKSVYAEKLAEKYTQLKKKISYYYDSRFPVVLSDASSINDCEYQLISKETEKIEPAVRNMTALQVCLETGKQQEYFRLLEKTLAHFYENPSRNSPQANELFMAVSSMLLSVINRYQLVEEGSFKYPLYKFYRADSHGTWAETAVFFKDVSKALFVLQGSRKDRQMSKVIEDTMKFIMEHLGDDLSLIMLADRVYLNPSYFSYMFKIKTGINVSDFIKHERLKLAKQLLSGRKHKIGKVAQMVGYENPAYFTRFFKQEMGISPQEYRDSIC